MVERFDGEQLPPVHPVRDGRAPLPDGQGVPVPTGPLPPRDLRRARVIAALVALVVLAAVTIGALR